MLDAIGQDLSIFTRWEMDLALCRKSASKYAAIRLKNISHRL